MTLPCFPNLQRLFDTRRELREVEAERMPQVCTPENPCCMDCLLSYREAGLLPQKPRQLLATTVQRPIQQWTDAEKMSLGKEPV